MLACTSGVSGLTDEERAGGWSGELTKGIPVGMAPTVEFKNVTIPIDRHANATGSLRLRLYDDRGQNLTNITLHLSIYGWGMLGEERYQFELETPMPTFLVGEGYFLDEDFSTKCYASFDGTLGDATRAWELIINVSVPPRAEPGFYRVSLKLEFNDDPHGLYAGSRGLFQENIWAMLLEEAWKGGVLSSVIEGVRGLLPEAGFTVAPPDFDLVSRPNRVPDFGNFTTPVIRPGEKGTYNFTISNRYDADMTDVVVRVELYMWATLEESKALDRLKGPKPKFDDGATSTEVTFPGGIPKGGRVEVRLDIGTNDDTPKGTYFVRHRLTFTYMGETYNMSSRGYFTTPQWEGFNYGNLYYQLNVSGIVPDSSISVKDPVPLWPLALLVGLCVFFGALAVVFYLAEEHGSEYPRLKKALQYWTGKLEQRRRLMQQRLDELRREVDVPLDDDEP